MNPELAGIGHLIQENAKSRWLHPEEIFLLLLRPAEMNFPLQSRYLTTPKAGDLLVFSQTKNVKDDGIEWAKKKDNSRLQETYMKIKINDVELIQGVYVKAASDEMFKRRIYKLIHPNKTGGKCYLVVHYRYDVDDSKAKGLDENIHLLVYQYLKQEKMYQQVEISNLLPSPVNSSSLQLMSGVNDNGMKEEKDFFPTVTVDSSQYPSNDLNLTCDLIEFSPKFTVSGILPEFDQSLLVILSQNFNEMTPIQIRFVHETNFFVDVVAVFITPHVVKCMIPSDLNLGVWQLFLLNSETSHVYGCTKTVFEVCESPLAGINRTEYDMVEEDDYNRVLGKRNHSSPRKFPGQVPFFPTEEQYDPDRQCKIRFVEKFSSFRQSAMGASTDNMQIDPIGSNGNNNNSDSRRQLEHSNSTSTGFHWLDDQELSKLTNTELESAMDNYLIQAKQQLISIAMTDEDTIRAEIDALDSYGFNLLHYCCTNNFIILIPELLKKGAQINQRTVEGLTPLHLASASGHSDVVELLLNNGADITAVDIDGETVVDAAANNGHETIANRLEQIAKSQGQSSPRSNRKGRLSIKKTDTDLEGENPNSSRMLQEAFSSLSLTDKVALSMTENQSVISETDKESLRHAMNLMGPKELQHVEDEVKKIQNNVRGWILRKNYISLREATKTLQVAWRTKREKSVHLPSSNSNDPNHPSKSSSRPEDLIHNRNGNNSLRSNFLDARANSKTMMAFDPDSFANGEIDDEDAVSALVNLSRFNSNNSDIFANEDKTTGTTVASNDGRPGLTRFASVNSRGNGRKNPFFVSDDDHEKGGSDRGVVTREDSNMSIENYRQNSLTLPDLRGNNVGNERKKEVPGNEEQERAAVKLQALFRKIKSQDNKSTPYRNALKQLHASNIIQRSMKRWISNSRGVGFPSASSPMVPGNQTNLPVRVPFPTNFPSSFPNSRSSFPTSYPTAQTDLYPQSVQLPGEGTNDPNPPIYSSGFSSMKPEYRMDSLQSELFDEILAIPDNAND